eukprot:TRINITY_DN25811_c0_g1_i1.p1 TRINITY_DN25811_c0_g1~~TRINITY_DN25811_c0_g1_i1.p1  ORF type:complete len:241 (-),score=49.74 TRINITY_DN25811_c0_g1_i1:71-691(-)
MISEQIVSLKQEIDASALKMQKTVVTMFLMSLVMLLQAYVYMYNEFIYFLYGMLGVWIVLTCGYKGALRRRSWQLFLYNLLSLVVVFVITFFYTYTSYNVVHDAIQKHSGFDKHLAFVMTIVGLSYFYWMILTVVSMIRATQIFILLKFLKSESAKIDLESPVDTKAFVKSYQPGPETVLYYPLSAPGTNLVADGNNYVDFSPYRN